MTPDHPHASERGELALPAQPAHFDGDGNDLGPCVLVSDLERPPADPGASAADAETEHRRVLAKGGAQETGWLHAACSCGEHAWPCPHWLLAEHESLTDQLTKQRASIERAAAIHTRNPLWDDEVEIAAGHNNTDDICVADCEDWPCPTYVALTAQQTAQQA